MINSQAKIGRDMESDSNSSGRRKAKKDRRRGADRRNFTGKAYLGKSKRETLDRRERVSDRRTDQSESAA